MNDAAIFGIAVSFALSLALGGLAFFGFIGFAAAPKPAPHVVTEQELSESMGFSLPYYQPMNLDEVRREATKAAYADWGTGRTTLNRYPMGSRQAITWTTTYELQLMTLLEHGSASPHHF